MVNEDASEALIDVGAAVGPRGPAAGRRNSAVVTARARPSRPAVDEQTVAEAWHDVTCADGAGCRDRRLHASVMRSEVAGRFLDRLAELSAAEAVDEWCVYAGTGPDDTIILLADDRAEVEDTVDLVPDGGIAVRTLTTGRWRVLPLCPSCLAVVDGGPCCDGRNAAAAGS